MGSISWPLRDTSQDRTLESTAAGYYETTMTTTQSTTSIQNLNPSTGELLAESPCATSEEVQDAVVSARAPVSGLSSGIAQCLSVRCFPVVG